MKRILILLMLIGVGISIFGRDIKVGIYENKPLVYIDDKKEPQGVYIDLLDYIAKNEKWQIQYVYTQWSDCLRLLEKDSIDILVDVAYSEKRAETFSFNKENVFVNWGIVYSPEKEEISNIFDLRNKRIAGVTGDVYFEELSNLLNKFEIKVKMIGVNEYASAFNVINDKKADYAVVNRLFGALNEAQYHVKSSNIIFRPAELRFATNKNKNTDLLKTIDYHLANMKLSNKSILTEIINQHISGVKSDQERSFLQRAKVFIIAFQIVLITILLFLFYKNYRKLKKSSRLYSANQAFIINNYPNAIIEIDSDLVISKINNKTSLMLNLEENDIVNQNINKFLSTPITNSDVLTNSVKNLTFKNNTNDYHVKALIYNDILKKDSYFIIILNNINNDRFLNETENQYRLKDMIIDSIPFPFIISDLKGKIIKMNNPSINDLKIPDEETINKIFINDFFGSETSKTIIERVSANSITDFKLNSDLYIFDGSKTEVEVQVNSFLMNHEEYIVMGFHNIEQEKQLLSEVHYRNEFLKELFEKSPLGIVLLDHKKQIVDVNKQFIEIFGFTKEELLFKDIQELLRFDREYDDNYEDVNYLRDIKCYSKKGDHLIIRVYGNSLIIDGKHSGFFEIYKDISEEKNIMEMYKGQADQFNLLLKYSQDIIIEVNNEGQIEHASDSFYEITGYRIDETSRDSDFIFEHIYYEDRERVKKEFSSKKHSNNQDKCRFRFVCKDERIIWLEENTSFILNEKNKLTKIIILCREITNEIVMSNHIQDLNNKLIGIIDKIDDGIVTVDESGNIKIFNKSFQKLVNYDSYTIENKKIFEIIHIDNHFMNNSNDLMEMQTDNYKVFNDCEIAFNNHIKKKHYTISISKYRLPDNSLSILFVIRDMTNQKKMLNELVKLKNLEVIQSSMLHVANDFNNILTAIMGHIALLKMTGNIPPSMLERILKAEEASIKAMELTHKIFPLENNTLVKKDYYSLSALLETLMIIAPNNIRIDKQIPEELPPVFINFKMTKNAIVKLFENACESMPKGGMITLKAEEIDLVNNNIFSLDEGKYIKFSIMDKGEGIAEKDLELVFDPYYSTRNKEGLGLTQAFHLLRSEDAYINLISEEKKGTVAEIYLPLKSNNLEEKIEIKEIRAPFKILFMDDEQLVLDIAEEYLKRLGFEITLVKNGDEVMTILAEDNSYDVVILDLVVAEGMGARETIKKIRELNHDVKVFLSTGLKTELSLMDYKKYGFDEAIEKPIDFMLLKEKIYRTMYSKNN